MFLVVLSVLNILSACSFFSVLGSLMPQRLSGNGALEMPEIVKVS